MSLERLWAGWRSDYIDSIDEPDDRAPGAADGPGAGAVTDPPAATRAPDAPAAFGAVTGDPDADTAAGSKVGAESRAQAESTVGAGERCVFCRILSSGEDDRDTHVVWRDPSGLVVALLNAYPYATGHLMVMPVRHTGDLETLGEDEVRALWAGVADAVRAVKASYRPDGLNVGINLGRAAGAGVPGHLHVHVLPRWVGDSNFMTSVAETRVLPEALQVTAGKLRRTWPPGT